MQYGVYVWRKVFFIYSRKHECICMYLENCADLECRWCLSCQGMGMNAKKQVFKLPTHFKRKVVEYTETTVDLHCIKMVVKTICSSFCS